MDLFLWKKSKLWKLYKNLSAYVLLHYPGKIIRSATEIIDSEKKPINVYLTYKADKLYIARECNKMIDLFLDKELMGRLAAIDMEIEYLRDVFTALFDIDNAISLLEAIPNYLKEQYPSFFAIDKEKVKQDKERVSLRLRKLFEEQKEISHKLSEQKKKIVQKFLSYG